MNYKIVHNENRYCIVVEYIKDNQIAEMSFVIDPSGDLNLLQNALKVCENNLYYQLNREVYNESIERTS